MRHFWAIHGDNDMNDLLQYTTQLTPTHTQKFILLKIVTCLFKIRRHEWIISFVYFKLSLTSVDGVIRNINLTKTIEEFSLFGRVF